MNQQCQEAEGKYRKFFEESQDAIVIVDPETGKIVDCNVSAALLVERDKSELIGQHQSILHPQIFADRDFPEEFKEPIKNIPATPFETQVVTKTGKFKYVSIKATMFEFQGKKFLLNTYNDVTDIKSAQMITS